MGDQPSRPRSADDPPRRRRPPDSPSGPAGPNVASRRRPPSGPDRTAPSAGSSRAVVVVSIIGALVVVALVAFVIVRPGGGTGVVAPGTASTTTTSVAPGADSNTGTTLPDSELTTYVDDDAGFSLRYPKSWERFRSDDPDVQLVAAQSSVDDGPAGNGLVVRMFRSEVATTSENLENVRSFTDGVVGSNPTAKVLQQRVININGMPGYFYLYTFTDEITGREGAHGHYFLFRGRKVNQLILQAVPTEGYARLAQVFDQIGESFKSDPDTVPPVEAPATTSATTTPG